MPSVSLLPTNWIREDVIFLSVHVPLPFSLKRFNLSDSDQCICGGTGTALHYATECAPTVSSHMRRPAPNFELEWLKRVANNLVSRQKNCRIVKFIGENRDFFRDLPRLQLSNETQQATNDQTFPLPFNNKEKNTNTK
ncbi:hypothetical protein AVEN_134675-1 [Araneus ventricosus]|uniref:Uncharacterized protein n=1 Tax=Araneus ventricosus TaxID=182803 RepID=A0A4Y2F5M0_ARAVE|nr:hypothetical protein AVEN_134675-1 [Araneus ventricosus]